MSSQSTDPRNNANVMKRLVRSGPPGVAIPDDFENLQNMRGSNFYNFKHSY